MKIAQRIALTALAFIMVVPFNADAGIFGKGKKKKKKKGKTEQVMDLNKDLDKASYSLGLSIGKNLMSQGLDSINPEAFTVALKDVYFGDSTKISVDDAQAFLNTFFENIQKEKATKMQEEGKKFLEENAKKEGITTTESGLQYEVIEMGTGDKPVAANTVKVHYTGTLLDGTVFDSSVQRGQPAVFGLGQVIKGWTEGLQLMPVGSKFRFYIPFDLAYGERGAGGQIGPYATLIFDVELISIEQ